MRERYDHRERSVKPKKPTTPPNVPAPPPPPLRYEHRPFVNTVAEIYAARQLGRTQTITRVSLETPDGPVDLMPVPRCDGCKWWEKNKAAENCGYCSLAELDEDVKAHAGSPDGRGWLATMPDFGCVQWEQKP